MKTFKRLFMLIAAVIIACSVANNYPSFSRAAVSTPVGTMTATGIPRKAVIGETVPVDAKWTIYSPKGVKVTRAGSDFEPTEAGYFTVCADSEGKVVFGTIKVTVPDVRLHIPYGGAEIPTIVGTEKDVTLPKASIVVYNDEGEEDEELTKDLEDDYDIITTVRTGSGITVANPNSEINLDSSNKFRTSDKAGSYLVRYSAKAKTGSVEKTLDYTITTQKGFTDTEAPVISALNVPSTGNPFTKVIIPSVTATDNYDTNVKITVKVTDSEGNNVKKVNEEDEEDIKEITPAEDVEFLNDKPMYFYPTKDGRYTVTYTACDDVLNAEGKPANVSTSSSYIVVSDTKAPVIVIDDEDIIPTVWGKQVYKAKVGDPTDKVGTQLTGDKRLLKIPVGRAYDNVKKDKDGNDIIIKVDVSLRDAKSNTFFDTSVPSKDAKNTEGVYDATEVPSIAIESDYFTFDIEKYVIMKNGEPTGEDTTGAYTITYRAKDAAGHESTKTYTVTFENTFRDLDAPTISVSNKEDIFWAGEKFVMPTIKVSDEKNTRVISEKIFKYTPFVTSGTATTENFKDLNKDFRTRGTDEKSLYDILEDEGQIAIPEGTKGKVEFEITAEDQVGNPAEVIPGVTTGSILIKDSSDSSTPVIANRTAVEFTTTDSANSDAKFKANTKIELLPNPIVITAAKEEYIGYEVLILDANKKAVTSTVDTLVTTDPADSSKDRLTINQITFTPKAEGIHTVYVRGLTISGASDIIWTEIDIAKASNSTGGLEQASSSIPSTAEVGSTVTLPKYVETSDGWKPYIEITGARYELKGNLFTPRDAGDYIIKIYNKKGTEIGGSITRTIKASITVDPVFQALEAIDNYKNKFNESAYQAALTKLVTDGNDTSAERLKVARAHLVEIPDVSVINATGTVKITTTVSHSKDSDVNKEEIEGFNFFRPNFDGVYTVTYKATSSTRSSEHSVTVKVGDLVAPTLDILDNAEHPLTMKQNDLFRFFGVDVSDEVTTDKYNITVTKTIYYPNGDVYKTETGRAASNVDYKLDKAGTYKVVYTATDEAGNKAEKSFPITVSSNASNTTSRQMILTILIIIISVLAVGLIVYFLFFGKVDDDKRKAKAKAKAEKDVNAQI